MADPAPVAAVDDAAAAATAESAPRKRRRRAPTTGASVDCFACIETQTACDRRRPYCTPCIERGKTCSGYKTQLTWGVGVASRGKLRGLSLPVAAAAKKSAAGGDAAKATARRTASTSAPAGGRPPPPAPPPPPPPPPPAAAALPHTTSTQPSPAAITAAAPGATPAMFRFGASSPPAPTSAPSSAPAPAPFTWTSAAAAAPVPAPHSVPPKMERRHSLQPLQMPPPNPAAGLLSPSPMTASVYGGYGFGYGEGAALESPATPLGGYYEPMPHDKVFAYPSPWPQSVTSDGYHSTPTSASWPSATVSSSMSSTRSSRDFHDEDVYHQAEFANHTPLSARFGNHQPRVSYTFPYQEFTPPDESEEYNDVEEVVPGHKIAYASPTELSLSTQTTLQGPLVGKTANLRELIRYYEHVIAPVILAFDGPSNPWRTHIIRLASGSDALQHAIAALAASNLRMRRDHDPLLASTPKLLNDSCDNSHDVSVRKSSIAHQVLRGQVDSVEDMNQRGQHSTRELYHKGQAIRALNAELSQLRLNPAGGDDTVLATLLVLCLYHICDTGVAKFRTQFAGVKKLIALRNRRAKSADANWLLLLFKWFDAITATVNNRESQFEEYIEDDESGEWALENLAGCDGRLLKIVSRLGRINLLSQGLPVDTTGLATPRAQPPRPPQYDPAGPFTSGALDGGYAAPPPRALDQPPLADAGYLAAQFAREWYALHQALLDWQFDPAAMPATMRHTTPDGSGGALDPDVIDFQHISESFRYSALLYLERVAHPALPSAAPNFSRLVHHAMYHIEAVKSDVYLLWPLFITGAECVQAHHRELIRLRCRSIQSDSGFYNNTSTLDVLEKTWEEKDRGDLDADARDVLVNGPFKWRKNMASGDGGEHIVI